MEHLKEFELKEVLSSDTATKSAVLLGDLRGQPCLLKLSRLALPDLQSGPDPAHLPIDTLNVLAANSVYSFGTGTLAENGTCYFDVIYPASETHIAKYRVAPKRIVTETPEMYETRVKPYIESQRGDRLDWVRGILHRGVEADRVEFRDDQFVLIANSKWDQKTTSSLYMLVLVMTDKLASVRDLDASHIPLLEHIRDTSCDVVERKWGLPRSQIKTFFHYQPTYYHLHVHVVNVALEQNDFGKSLLLDNVIDMLRLRPMREANLTYMIPENHEVYKRLQE